MIFSPGVKLSAQVKSQSLHHTLVKKHKGSNPKCGSGRPGNIKAPHADERTNDSSMRTTSMAVPIVRSSSKSSPAASGPWPQALPGIIREVETWTTLRIPLKYLIVAPWLWICRPNLPSDAGVVEP